MITATLKNGSKIIWNDAAKKWKYPNGRTYTGQLPEYCIDEDAHPVMNEMIHDHFKRKNKTSWWEDLVKNLLK